MPAMCPLSRPSSRYGTTPLLSLPCATSLSVGHAASLRGLIAAAAFDSIQERHDTDFSLSLTFSIHLLQSRVGTVVECSSPWVAVLSLHSVSLTMNNG